MDDDIADGNQSYTVKLNTAISNDNAYDGLGPDDVLSVINVDRGETPGITVSEISGHTTEVGVDTSFTVSLNSQPLSDVTIAISSSDIEEGTVSPSSLTFSPDIWNMEQIVKVIGVDDNLVDGPRNYQITFSTVSSDDSKYDGLKPDSIPVVNEDFGDSAGITVNAISGNTTEAGGAATFTVRLNSQPLSEVTIALNSSDSSEGTVSSESIVFTQSNWNIEQTVTVTGVDDTEDDDNQSYTIQLGATDSEDSIYNGIYPDDVTVINSDDDSSTPTDNDQSPPTNGGDSGGSASAGGGCFIASAGSGSSGIFHLNFLCFGIVILFLFQLNSRKFFY